MQQAEQTAPRKRALNQWLSVISKPKVFFVSKKRLSSAKPHRDGPKPAFGKPTGLKPEGNAAKPRARSD